MEEETSHWNNKNKKDISYIKGFIGKNCLISFEKHVVFPSSGFAGDHSIQATIQDCNESYLIIKFDYKKKKYISALDINNITGITFEEQ